MTTLLECVLEDVDLDTRNQHVTQNVIITCLEKTAAINVENVVQKSNVIIFTEPVQMVVNLAMMVKTALTIALLDIMEKTVAANVDIVLITYHVTMLPGIALGDAYLVIRNKRVLKLVTEECTGKNVAFHVETVLHLNNVITSMVHASMVVSVVIRF